MSNNSRRIRINTNFDEKIPNYIKDLLRFLEKWASIYKITSEVDRNRINIILRQKESKDFEEKIKVIKLTISTEPKFYLIYAFELCNNNLSINNPENLQELYQIKVEGDFEISSIKDDVKKLIKRKNFTHYRKYYPF
ncbi:MAG: hypothetical protein ACFE96_05735 [Candidatus Hermodarchaeota archaeon]